MGDQIHLQLVVTNLVSSSGACRLQVLGGHTIQGQSFIADMELTATQNAALSTALAAAATTVTTLDFPQGALPLPGLSNAV